MPIRTEKGKDRYAEIQLAMWFENVRNAEIQLTKDTLQEIQRLKSSGMSSDNIAKSFMDRAKAGNGFEKSFLNNAAHELWQDMKAITQHEVYSSMDDGDYYKWVYNPSAKHCEVCMELNGKVKTFEEWEAEGLPGHRNEGCYANCCCDLVKVDNYSRAKAPSKKEKGSQENKNSTEDDGKYVKLLQEKFTSDWFTTISIENIESLKREYQKELLKIINDVETIYGNDILSVLDTIKATDFEKEYGGKYKNNLGMFIVLDKGTKDEKNVLAFNTRYFGKGTSDDDNATTKHELNSFALTTHHELGHYYYKKFGVGLAEMKRAVETFYNKHEKYILKEFDFLDDEDYKQAKRPEEFCVEALGRLREGILTKLYGKDKKTDKAKETNKKVLEFVQKIDEIIKNKQAGNEKKVSELTKELREMIENQEEKKKANEKNSKKTKRKK